MILTIVFNGIWLLKGLFYAADIYLDDELIIYLLLWFRLIYLIYILVNLFFI